MDWITRKYPTKARSKQERSPRGLALAASALERTLAKYERNQKWRLAAQVCTELGKIYARLKRWDASLQHYRMSMDYYTKHQDALADSGLESVLKREDVTVLSSLIKRRL